MATTDIAHEDYEAARTSAGWFDRSAQGKLAVSGAEAAEFVDSLVSNDVAGLGPGEGCGAALLTHKGRMLAELRVLRTAERVWLDTERVSLQALFDALHQYRIGYRAELHKQTLERAMVSLIGPDADGAVETAPPAAEYAHLETRCAGVGVLAVRTDAGIDLICDSGELGTLVAGLRERGLRELGEDVVECLRVERGRPRFGVDMDEATMPQEAGIHLRTVSYEKGCYVGQETVARLYWKGKPNRHLRGLRLTTPVPSGTPIRAGELDAGRLGSVAVSPAHGPIGLALVRREVEPGAAVELGDGVSATVVELPFA